jgi:hypothetical protein
MVYVPETEAFDPFDSEHFALDPESGESSENFSDFLRSL